MSSRYEYLFWEVAYTDPIGLSDRTLPIALD
jgi:hypothetical protein